ncbi:hypothetical protein MMC28_004126 [Mycoblastus sanguinarius]|nr:hypothetical protein [Mycoblastus sanguinarius]
MTHFYMQEASLGTHTDPPEIYPLNQCVFSDALISIHNPQNYQFYVALVQQGCIEAPDPDIPPYLIPANDTIPTNVSSPTTSPPASLVDLYADPLGVFPSLATTPPGIFSLDSGSVRGVVSPEITLSRYPASVQASTVGILELLPAPSLVALDPIDREIGDNNSNPIVAIS